MGKHKYKSYGARLVREYAKRRDTEIAMKSLVRKSARDLINSKRYPPYRPIDFMEYNENIVIEDSHDLICDARLLPICDGYLVEINKGVKLTSIGRYNFSFFHEIGHTFFFESESALFNRTTLKPTNCVIDEIKEVKEEEKLCNKAAAEFLMPEKQFFEIARSYNPSISSVKELAKLHHSSLWATLKQIRNIKAWECVFVKLSPIEQCDPEMGFRKEWMLSSNELLGGKLSSRDLVDTLIRSINNPNNDSDLGLFSDFENQHYSCKKVRPNWRDSTIKIESEKFHNNGSPYVISLLTLV